jgi:hypothetical protein
MVPWFRKIEDARNIAELLATTREYLATWTAADLALVPSKCRPGRIGSEAELEALHRTLVEEYRASQAQGEPLAALQRLTSFMVRACVRASQLNDKDDPPKGPPGGSATPRSARSREN